MARSATTTAYEMLTGEDEGRACSDIPESACRHQPRNFVTHVASLGATKTADGLIDPKLVLAWLMAQVGAPAALVGLLVPVREAGALLPQLLTAGYSRGLPRRKWVWVAGSVVQGLAALGIAAAALLLDGATAGWTILALLALLAVARSLCSVAFKDVLGKTVDRARRGTATGTATALGSAAVILFALTLILELGPRGAIVLWAIMLAGGLWLLAAALFATLREEPGATEGGESMLAAAWASFGLLRSDPGLRRFILARALLVPTALAPPYMVALVSATPGRGLESLGALVLASALAGVLSAYVWGRLADRSSRLVLAATGAAAAVTLALTAVADAAGWLVRPLVLPALVFALMVAYHGVRLGRTTHLVDMATPDTRAPYTALSNTLIGAVLLAGGGFALMADLLGVRAVIVAFAAISALAVPAALALGEVQDRDRPPAAP
jgi:hypothetical protein